MKVPSQQLTLKDGKVALIRSLEPDDAADMIRFMKTVDGESRFLTREPDEFAYTEEQERGIIAARLEDPGSVWLAAEIGGRLAANCGVTPVGGKQRLRHRAVMGIVVAKEYWGLGLGRKLMQEAIAWCRQAGYEQLELDVVAGNSKAQALYHSLGFTIQGTRWHAMKYPDGTYADDYSMVLKLTE